MECNAIRQAVCANEVVYDSVVEVPLENDVILPDYCPDIVKVLKCTVNACVSSTQVQGRQMTLEGMCTVHLLYLGEDSAGSSLQLRSIDTRMPYSKTVDLKGEAQRLLVLAQMDSSYCNCRAVSKRRLELKLSLSYRVCALSAGEQQLIGDSAEDTQQPQGLQLRKRMLEQCCFVAQPREIIDIREELELGGSKPAVRSMISSRGCAVMSDHKLISGKIVTKGELRITVLYNGESSTEEGAQSEKENIQQMDFVLPISAVIDAPGADDGCLCLADYSLCELEISPKLDQNGENTLFELEAKVSATAQVCRIQQAQVADDCYSTRYECEGQLRPLSFLESMQPVEESCLYKGEVELPEGVEEILSGWGQVSGSAVRFEEQEGKQTAVLQVNLDLCLLALDADGSIQFYNKTEQMECPFAAGAGDDSRLLFCPQLTVVGFDYNRTTANLAVRCEVQVRGMLCRLKRCNLLEEVTVDESKPIEHDQDCSLTIYYADAGETLWEIAKRYHTAMQSVLEANSQLELSPQAGVSKREMLLIPILSH